MSERTIPSAVDNPNPKKGVKRKFGPSVSSPEAIGSIQARIDRLHEEHAALCALQERLQSEDWRFLTQKYIPTQKHRIAIEFFEAMDPANPALTRDLMIAYGKFLANDDLTQKLSLVKTQRQNIEEHLKTLHHRLEQINRKRQTQERE